MTFFFFFSIMTFNTASGLSVTQPQSVPVSEEILGHLKVILTVDEFSPHTMTLESKKQFHELITTMWLRVRPSGVILSSII